MFPVIIAYNSRNESGSTAVADVVNQAGGTVYQATKLSDTIKVFKEKKPQVLIVGDTFDNSSVLDVIPIFKHLQKNLKIILLSDNCDETFLGQARAAGIFYHALELHDVEDSKELQLVLECAKEASEKSAVSLWGKLSPLVGIKC